MGDYDQAGRRSALHTYDPSYPFRSPQVGVHIADVTRFMSADGPLDREARLRGTTVYLVHRRIDMLPALLSSDLCSLHAHRDRLSVSVVWEVEEDGEDIRISKR